MFSPHVMIVKSVSPWNFHKPPSITNSCTLTGVKILYTRKKQLSKNPWSRKNGPLPHLEWILCLQQNRCKTSGLLWSMPEDEARFLRVSIVTFSVLVLPPRSVDAWRSFLKLPPQLAQNAKKICTWAPQQVQNMLSSMEWRSPSRLVVMVFVMQNGHQLGTEDNGNLASITSSFFLHWKIVVYVHWQLLSVHWENFYVLRNVNSCHGNLYLCTGNLHVSALKNTFVHWKIHLCTKKYICALKNTLVRWKIHLCTEKHIFVHWKTCL